MTDARIDLIPEAVGLVASGDFFLGMGGGGDYGFIYVEGKGFNMIINGRGGLGLDISGGGNILLGFTSERIPDYSSISGFGIYANTGIGGFNVGVSRSYAISTFETLPWSFINVGYAVGSKTFTGGSAGITATKVIPLYDE